MSRSDLGADAGVVSRIYASLHAKGLEKSNIIFSPVDLRFAGKDKRILSDIDVNLVEMKQNPDSAYYKAFEKWFGHEV